MVISEKRLQANRLNSLMAREHATGPHNTSATRFNAVKHGLTSLQPIILQGENKEDYDRLCENIIDRFSPQNEVEKELANQIALCMWRLRRGWLAESAVLESYMDIDDNVVWIGVLQGDYLGKIGAYERRIWGQLNRLLKKFKYK